MTYKILSTRTTPDGGLFLNTEFNIDGEIHVNEIAVSLPSSSQDALSAVINYAKSYKWKKDAIANLESVVILLPVNEEITIE